MAPYATSGERDISAELGYDHRMVISGMIVVGIGSAIGTTIAMTRNPELFDSEQRKREASAHTPAGRLRLGRERPRDGDLIDR